MRVQNREKKTASQVQEEMSEKEKPPLAPVTYRQIIIMPTITLPLYCALRTVCQKLQFATR